MKRYLPFLFLVAVLGAIFGHTPAMADSDMEAMVAAANALDEAFVAAFNQGDAEALAGLYWDNPDVVSFPPDAFEARGMAAIKESAAQTVAGLQGATLELTETHQMPAGDVVIGWGLWRVTTPATDGDATELVGRYTDVKAERDGKWVYLLDHASVPMPPPAE